MTDGAKMSIILCSGLEPAEQEKSRKRCQRGGKGVRNR